uniref:Uncharacterized protein n=1 Tax=Setaria italica TaxID=4555 RepID=K3YEK8_SETIT
MNESIEFFEGPPSFTNLVDRAMRKYGCRVDEMSLRGRFDCGKARAHYVLMNLASNSNWKHYKDVVHEANVACLEVIVEIVRSEFEEDGVVGVEAEEESLSQSGGHENEDEEIEYEEDGSQFDTATVHDVEGIGRMDECFSYTQNELQLLKEHDVELPPVPNDKDISMVHKAICESSMAMKFNSLEELKFFLVDYAVRLHRPFSVVHSNKNLRYNVMCKQGCHWRVWSRVISSTGQWRISNVVQLHTCRSSQPKRVHVQCTIKYLGWRILGIIRKDSETSVPSLVESIFAFSGYRVKYSKAWWAKQHAVALLWGDRKESYGMVPRVLIAIAYYNPEAILVFPQCGEAFQHCHPVILVDGTFLTTKYKGTLIIAVGVDPEQQLVPLSFALAEMCMISDRHHGLLNCAKDHMDGFPLLVHRWCTRHFAANMSRRQKSDRVIGKLKTLCKVHVEREFSEKLEDLVKDLNDDAKEWLKGEIDDKDKWAQAFKIGAADHPCRARRLARGSPSHPLKPTGSYVQLARQLTTAAPGGVARQPPSTCPKPTESSIQLAWQLTTNAPGGVARQPSHHHSLN